ncbi:MAG: SRPBCC family protein [Acidimicrobiales bacterium]|nr:SRPBCC family protein [Acidimicrobiales bacterium]
MAEHVTQTIVIDAPPERCFAVASDFEHYPEWATDVKEVQVVRRDADGKGGDVHYRAAAMGRSTAYTLRYFYGSNPLRMAWRLVEGDLTRRLDGEYEFQPIEGDPDRTLVVYHLLAELVVPLAGFIKRRAEARIMRTALDDLRARVEATAVTA